MVTPAVKREAVAHLRNGHEMSERRACRVIGCERMTVRYRSRRPDDTKLRERLRALAHERRRFGYRRLLVFTPPSAGDVHPSFRTVELKQRQCLDRQIGATRPPLVSTYGFHRVFPCPYPLLSTVNQ